MSDEFSIKVTIGNRVYPLTIGRDEEENIRKAARMVNDNMRELELRYAVRDRQDLLAMTALFYANKSVEKQDGFTEREHEAIKLITGLNEMLENQETEQ